MDRYILSVMQEIGSKWSDTANLLTRFFFLKNSPESNSCPVQDKWNSWPTELLYRVGEITPCILSPCKKMEWKYVYLWLEFNWFIVTYDTMKRHWHFLPLMYKLKRVSSALTHLSCTSWVAAQSVGLSALRCSVLSQTDPAKWAAYRPPVYGGSR